MSSLHDRFWSKVRPEVGDGCWLWTGAKRDGNGYGSIMVRSYYSERAHRVSWEIAYGPIPDGMCVLHRCDNPPCVRPDHLFLGTKADNNKDRMLKGRGGSRKIAGEKNKNAKLFVAEIPAIRAAYASGVKRRALATKYGVTWECIDAILKRKTWKHV